MAAARKTPGRPGTLRVVGVLLPLVAVAMASPITAGALGQLPDCDALLLVAPTLLAVVGAPGYLWAVVRWTSLSGLSSFARLWVRGSFVLGLLAAGIGAVIGLAFVIPTAAALFTAAVVVKIWTELEARQPPR